MSTFHESREHLLELIGQLKSYYDKVFPDRAEPGVFFIYGGAASQNPAFCYRMWSECGFPLIFENATRCEIEEAFGLWQRGPYDDVSESEEDEEDKEDKEEDEDEEEEEEEEEEEKEKEEEEEEEEEEEKEKEKEEEEEEEEVRATGSIDVETNSSDSESDEDTSSSDQDDEWLPSHRLSMRNRTSSHSPLALPDDHHPRDSERTDDDEVSEPPESVFDLEATPSEVSGHVSSVGSLGTSIEGRSSSSRLSSVEASHASGSSAHTRGRKRARDDDDEDFVAGTRSTKKKGPTAGQYQCPLGDCREVFSGPSELKRHMKTARKHATRAFQCPGCLKTIPRSDSFTRHYVPEKPDASTVACREALRNKAGLPTWTTDTAHAMLRQCEVAYART